MLVFFVIMMCSMNTETVLQCDPSEP